MSKKVVIAQPPQLVGIPRVDFLTPDFDSLVWNKGLNVTIEPAFECPCRKRNEAQSTCLNCQGTGWVFGTAIQTKAVVYSINKSTKFKEWSAELIGTVNITVQNKFQLGFMDKVTIIDSEVISSENIMVKKYSDGTLYAVTLMPIKSVDFLFQFVSVSTALKLISSGFTITDNKLMFDSSTGLKEGDSLSLRYHHNLQYCILDLNHDVRNTYTLDNNSQEQMIKMPISAIGRKLQFVLDGKNIAGDNIIYNNTPTTF